MKVVITGKNGYISNKLKLFLENKGIDAQLVDVRNQICIPENTDCIVHCAAVVHKNEKKFADLYDKVNYALTLELAKKAKQMGVGQFVFLSTMSVYGKTTGEININTPLNPITLYGKSKLKAEKALQEMVSKDFKVTILRPPMVYGENCKGNYARLRKLILPIFPLVDNKRSMIYVDNLANCIYTVITNGMVGIFLPQNKEYVNTSQMVNAIAKCHHKKQLLIKCNIIKKVPVNIVKKMFGDLWYNENAAFCSNVMEFEESIIKTENNWR